MNPRGHMPASETVTGGSANPQVSVVIPVRNAAACLQRCLEAIMTSTSTTFEVILVDDGSTDATPRIAERFPVVYLTTPRLSGPAAGRNLGAKHAKGEILLFVDADVVVQNDTLHLVSRSFGKDPQLAALLGSYDDKPAWNNLLSQYKNLMHHYIHQISRADGCTFWTGLGAIRKTVFDSIGGFNEKRYRRPSIEDIELGYRLRRANHKIVLEKHLQGKHLKKWTLRSLLDADILCRALPWSWLILETRILPRDLNLKFSYRISAVLVGVLILSAPLLLLQLHQGITNSLGSFVVLGWLLLFVCVVFLNRDLYRFFAQRKGFSFTVAAVGLHLFYYFYSGATFVLCWILFWMRASTLAALVALGVFKPAKSSLGVNR